ncbi:sigma factor [Echinicola jeungdonensis]|uniref:RNA polymerase sigma factor n=1 Tax=Echinicola jeungdonensis TaxID=709343 RepID=A0ABV5J999_9BACT|nr:sigma factor [Echinicola jeungdonensis]MDN3670494.1 sigma factor [Echinicola jeungdonensis]
MKEVYHHTELEDPNGLWHQLRQGDRKGLEGLYKHFSKDLFRYGLSLKPDQNIVQDCIQEVFIDLWKYHKNLQKADNVKVYLFKSLSYKMFREIKKEKKWKRKEVTENFEPHLHLQLRRFLNRLCLMK